MGRRADHPRRDGLNLLDGRWYADDPHEVWSWLRAEAPVYWDEASKVWGIARYDDVLAIGKDAQTFSSVGGPRPHGPALPMMISMDNPAHQRRRSLVSRGFTPRRVAEHGPRIAALCEEILDEVSEQGRCDLVWDVAAPLPLLMIADLLGFEPELHDDLLRWSDDLLRATSLDLTPEVAQAGADAMAGFREVQLAIIADRRATPRDDLISVLCHSEIDGERLDDESIVNETLLILIGGDETTRHVISGGVEALLQHPDQVEVLRRGPEAMATGVEELLRWVSPVKDMSRRATREVAVGDQVLAEGDQLILFYPSVNRDETVFAAPDRLDVTRDPNPHLAFGFGPHFCMGASLARRELTTMFEAILRRLPDLELDTDEPLPRRASNFVSGLESLPVRFTPTPRVAA